MVGVLENVSVHHVFGRWHIRDRNKKGNDRGPQKLDPPCVRHNFFRFVNEKKKNDLFFSK